MKFESLVKKGTKAVVLTGVLVMVATGVQYKGDLISGLNDKLNTLESMLGTYSSRYQKDKSTIESLNGSKSDLEGQLKVANGKVTKYETDLTDVAGKLGITMDETMGFDTDTKYEALKTAINNKIEANEGELEDVATILGCAEGDDISNAVQDLFNYYEEAQAEVTRLEGQLETANNVATNLQGELKKANDEIKRLEGIIGQYEGDLGSATTKAQGIINGKQTEINEIKNDTSNPSKPNEGNTQGVMNKQQAWDAFVASLSNFNEATRTNIANGTWSVSRRDGIVRDSSESEQCTLSSEQLRLYNVWYNMNM